MIAVTASQAFGPVEQVNGAAWVAAVGVLVAVWATVLVTLIARTKRRMARQRRNVEVASRFGGSVGIGRGGHQPVAPSLVARPVVVGRINARTSRRIGHQLERHARAGDPRLRYGMPRSIS